MYKEEDYLMISGIQHFLFCRRQWALIHIEQLWEENYLTIEGQNLHRKVDNPYLKEKRKEKITVRGLPIHSSSLGLTGICDVVEFSANRAGVYLPIYDGYYSIKPVEYKHGKEKLDLSDEMQLTAQALCLEEMMVTDIPEASLFYFETRQKIPVLIDESKRNILKEKVAEMRSYWDKGYTPKAKKSQKCNRCSLKDICLPTLENKESVKSYIQRKLKE